MPAILPNIPPKFAIVVMYPTANPREDFDGPGVADPDEDAAKLSIDFNEGSKK